MADSAVQSTNDLGYYEIDATTFRPLGDMLLVDWEEFQDEMRVGKKTLVRPDTHKKMHYTGVVYAVGPESNSGVKVGDRILFDQFSNFEKFWDPTLGRMALISERQQGSAFAIIPPRVRIGGEEGDYRYDR